MHTKKIAQFLKKLIKLWKSKSFFLIFSFIVIYLTFFFLSPHILNYMQRLFHQKFIFYSISEPIVSLLKFAFLLTFILIFPFIWYVVIYFGHFLFSFKKRFFLLFYLLGLLLFYSGAIFAYKVTFPYGIKFLLSFQTEKIEPAISLGHFVIFLVFLLWLLVLSLGCLFLLPFFLLSNSNNLF